MNKKRREALSGIVSEIEDLTARLESLAEEESDYFDSMPESLQGSERGQKAEETATALSDAASNLESVAQEVSDALTD